MHPPPRERKNRFIDQTFKVREGIVKQNLHKKTTFKVEIVKFKRKTKNKKIFIIMYIFLTKLFSFRPNPKMVTLLSEYRTDRFI